MTTGPPIASLRSRLLRVRLGAYVAGVGATAALIAGAVVAFLWLATFVAFNGLPIGGSSGDAGAAYLDSGAASAATAAALGRAPGAVAKNPVSVGSHGASKADGSVAAASARSRSSGSGDGGDVSGKVRQRDGADSGVTSPPVDVTPPSITAPSLPSTSGALSDAVRDVNDAAGTNLSAPSRGTRRAVEGAAGGALDRAGRALSSPGLGGRTGGAVSGLGG